MLSYRQVHKTGKTRLTSASHCNKMLPREFFIISKPEILNIMQVYLHYFYVICWQAMQCSKLLV